MVRTRLFHGNRNKKLLFAHLLSYMLGADRNRRPGCGNVTRLRTRAIILAARDQQERERRTLCRAKETSSSTGHDELTCGWWRTIGAMGRGALARAGGEASGAGWRRCWKMEIVIVWIRRRVIVWGAPTIAGGFYYSGVEFNVILRLIFL